MNALAQRLVEGERRPWLVLLVATRVLATGVAVALLAIDPADPALFVLAGYGIASTAVLAASARVRRSPAAWVLDSAIVLGSVVASGDWRSPFYLLWLTTLALPAVQMPLRAVTWLALGAAGGYLALGFVGGPQPRGFGPLTYETLAIHLILPVAVIAGLGYANDVLRRLQAERDVRERLAIERERRRIAWELHDSAKQRLHAAHLLVSSAHGRSPVELEPLLQRAVIELESASAEMDTSLAELRSPLEGRPLHDALALRAAELTVDDGPAISVRGRASELSPLAAAHVYRIACEAITNALRHAAAETIAVELSPGADALVVRVIDDGRGLPEDRQPDASAVMHGRAASIGASLTVARRSADGGTSVELVVPHLNTTGAPA